MTDYTTGLKYDSLQKYNTGSNMYYNSAAGMIFAGFFPILCIGMYYATNKDLNTTLASCSYFAIVGGFIFSIIYGVLWSISSKDAKKHPEKKTDGPAVYRGVFFANIALLITGILIILIGLLLEKRNGLANINN